MDRPATRPGGATRADIELSTSAAAWGMAFNGGQVCASIERILVQRSVRDAFVGHLVRKLRAIAPEDLGAAAVEETNVSKLDGATRAALNRVGPRILLRRLVGRDRGFPVCDDYQPPFPFTGRIERLVLEVPAIAPRDAIRETVAALHRE